MPRGGRGLPRERGSHFAAERDEVRIFENDLSSPDENFKSLNQAFPVGNFPNALAVGDLDKDGFPDLVTANLLSDNLSILVSNSGIPFDFSTQSFAAVPFPDAHVAVAIGELSQDPAGDLDLVTSVIFEAGIPPQLGVLKGTGNSNLFFPSPDPDPLEVGANVADSINSIEIGDVNEDGINDLVISHTGLNDFGVLLGTGGGNFAPEELISAGGSQTALVLGDLNLDGALDIVILDSINSVLRVLFGQGDGQFVLAQELAVGNRPAALVLADINADGLLDVVLTDELADAVLILLQAP